jgi:putative dehydrogenase
MHSWCDSFMTARARVAFIGYSEAGSVVAAELIKAGLEVVGFDSAPKRAPSAPPARSLKEALTGADLVFTISSATGPLRTAEEVAPLLGKGALIADLTTAPPSTKRELAALFPGGSYVDVAIVQLEPGQAGEVVLDVAGTGARKFVELLGPFGLAVEYVSEVPGEATARQLIRSLLAKSLAGAIIDCLWAAESMGMQNWAYQEILKEFEASSAETALQYLSGTAQHIKRRQIENMDVVAMLQETGYESTMLPGIEFNYGRILHGKKIPFSKRP